MKFDESLEEYVFETDGVIFAWEEEPQGNYEDNVKKIAANYNKQIQHIIDFMISDLQEMYGDIDANEVKAKLGKPIIEIGSGVVTYCEQTYDDIHIFSFEYLDDEFQNLQYFCIDG